MRKKILQLTVTLFLFGTALAEDGNAAGTANNGKVAITEFISAPGTVFKTITVASLTIKALTISGKVTDEKGGPLPGVNVKLKGTNIGVTTNAEGNYTLNIPGPDAVLVFSFVGFETHEQPVSGTTVINVVLKETSNGLNEVVVVGYGTQKRTDVVGAVSTISGKVLESRPLTNPLAGLQGTAPGLVIT
ncbi:MAG TPA: carboxypeptidase-like regulatory domain-containing protein, partial [Mucilaginibacter sp.]|nr:carboxypeptidase-like regulatory domain-containing protein [Mucilaginibacter sp.]